MPPDLPLRCTCGSVRGIARGVSARTVNRIVCYCADCQSFPHFLGRAERTLDDHGGTDISQMSPARLEITDGADRVACLRLTPTGMLRWYASCCATPIGNTTATHQMPFVGLIHTFVDHKGDGRSRDDAMGSIRARVNTGSAKGDHSHLETQGALAQASAIVRFATMLLMSRLRGEHKRSPFFDAGSGEPRAQPHVLSAEELQGVERSRDGV